LAALRSAKALPALLNIVSAHTDKLVWTEKANRDHCMATRALGMIGNKGAVPQLIPLLYHPNISTRWWAQIALVQLTGQNFGGDWNAWTKWWNEQNLPPSVGPELVRWWSGQEANPTKLMAMMTQLNREFFDGVGTTGETTTNNNTITEGKPMSYTLELQDGGKTIHDPAETDIRLMLVSHKDDFGPVLVINTEGTDDFIRVVAEQDGHFSFQYSPDGKTVFVSKKETFSVDEATKVAAGYTKGSPDWKHSVEWKELK
jgi:hypothetical protein